MNAKIFAQDPSIRSNTIDGVAPEVWARRKSDDDRRALADTLYQIMSAIQVEAPAAPPQ